MDCGYTDYRDVIKVCPPWQLDSGTPCRNDEVVLYLKEVAEIVLVL